MKLPLKDWQAWAPGIESTQQWQQFCTGTADIDSPAKPDVSFLPPMFRRKLSFLSRMIFSTVHSLEERNGPIEAPTVLATRHGELDLSIELINSEISGSPFSPARFSMSVHNSPVGFLSIQNKNRLANTAISAGKRTLEMGLYESLAMLEQHSQCLLIYADQALAEVYQDFKDEDDIPLCLALILQKGVPERDFSFSSADIFQPLQFIKQTLALNSMT